MIVDADVHNTVPSVDALVDHLAPYWQEQVRQSGLRGPFYELYPPRCPAFHREAEQALDCSTPDPGRLRRQVLDETEADYAILNCAYAIESMHNPDAAAAFAAAVNDWQVETWLDDDPRLRASVVVPSQSPELAAAEIARVGAHPGFVQIFIPARSKMPYGKREYRPLFAAAVEQGLVVGLQYGGFSGNAPTPVGWPTYFIEEYVGMASIVQSQLISLITEGVFDRFPNLRVAVVDGGFTWLPSLMWRFDKDWKGLRREVPWIRRPPSEYIREHIRFTISPIDAPSDVDVLSQILDEMWGGELLLYASDYPHWRSESREQALFQALSSEWVPKVMGENAAELYGLR